MAHWNQHSYNWDGYSLNVVPSTQYSLAPVDPPQHDSRSSEPHQDAGVGTLSNSTSAPAAAPYLSSEPLASVFPESTCPNLRAGRIPCECTDADEDLLRRLQLQRPDLFQALMPSSCQVYGCTADLQSLKGYHRRHRICEEHARAVSVFHGGCMQRYCQQCGRFHNLDDFDEGRRSCRRKLERHNSRRRRKKREQKMENGQCGSCDDEEGDEGTGEAEEEEEEGDKTYKPQSSAVTAAEPSVEESSRSKQKSPKGKKVRSGSPSAKKAKRGPQTDKRKPDSGSPSIAGMDVSVLTQPDLQEKRTETQAQSDNDPSRVAPMDKQQQDQQQQQQQLQSQPTLQQQQLQSHPTLQQQQQQQLQSQPTLQQQQQQQIQAWQAAGAPPSDVNSLMSLLMEDLLPPQPDQFNAANWRASQPPAYVTPTPASRVSFKLYDWNPGDFPRGLRNQIMVWLAQMPSELEGYIRPGCTVLTLRMAIPATAMDQASLLMESGLSGAVQRLLSHGCHIFTRGRMEVQWRNERLTVQDGRVLELGHIDSWCIDAISPVCVSPGQPVRICARGVNLRRPGAMLYVSMAGRYLTQQEILSDQREGQEEDSCNDDSVSCLVPLPDRDMAGLAWLEVEHEGICSSSVPLLVAPPCICREVCQLDPQMGQQANDFIADLGWVLSMRDSGVEGEGTMAAVAAQKERIQRLLAFAVDRGWESVTALLLVKAAAIQCRSKVMVAPVEEGGKSVKKVNDNSPASHSICMEREPFISVRERVVIRSGGRQSFGGSLLTVLTVALVACVGVCILLVHSPRMGVMAMSISRCLQTLAQAKNRP